MSETTANDDDAPLYVLLAKATVKRMRMKSVIGADYEPSHWDACE